ncbi:MAG: 2-oxoacid ferredoxin oxidoreductase [Elusimicrobia bacterium RIFOXYC2_FULL_34_12]|nr:MAG: 2-oxoacid ferredoxin oxidoreductase [Elusimicrobia bacterium RIFOXYC2_FULL_34_12]OGS38678.1 MAG: 2-oxoacid ferredoxin oxidoreductase [Elusimicrobia bacterium RIFOXYD2_FULL_34_30]HAM39549.1 2-oxoacid ferredoxin oxidoreductase [Elusimicrobiota bacterium]
MAKIEDFKNNVSSAWCPGCSNFSILTAVKNAFVKLDIRPQDIVIVSGIGQAGKLPHYINCNVFNGLHGRTLPVATAIKAVNPKLTVIAVAGDGDMYGEGGNHLLHAFRRNPDITVIVHNNGVYALTKGQASPTTELGIKTKLQFDGVIEEPMNPLVLAIAMNCSFVARGFAGDLDFLSELITLGIRYKGFSLIDIIQPCLTFGVHQVPWYKDKVYRLTKEYNPNDRDAAFKKAGENKEKIPTGILYVNNKPIFPDIDYNLEQKPVLDKAVLKELLKTFE